MRIHGRSGVAYLGVNYGDAASPVAFLSSWEITFTREIFDATAITDSQIVHGTGTLNVSGSFSGFYDTASAQSYAAAVDGLPRNMCLYPSLAAPGTFFSGMVLPDYSLGSGVTSATALTATWVAEDGVILTRGGTYPAVYAAVYA
jgi:hypothetical protein